MQQTFLAKIKNLSLSYKLGLGFIALCAIFAVFSLFIPYKQKADRTLFLEYYRQTIHLASQCDSAYRPFAVALGNREWSEATRIATMIRDPLAQQWMTLSDLGVPHLQDKNVVKLMEKADAAIVNAYYHKLKIVDAYMDFSQNPTSLFAAAEEMEKSGEKAQQEAITGMILLSSAGLALGIQPEDIK